ncbi:MAG: hypothetical protein KGR98_00940 [Verrucomicrobia bacterium]|nr:hypothetical protein [Verrucomicrobiota bacterium]MDE3099996.1 hypothetical protein [Verrucomicrobiota bacterium]
MTHALCQHLRTKKMFTAATVEEAFEEKDPSEASPCHFWCNLTQTVIGVDDQPVSKHVCLPSRSCFEE